MARACKVEGNEWLSKIQELQLIWNLRYSVSRADNPFVMVLGFDA